MTMDRKFLIGWLAKEDSSAYGECKGKLLDELIADGLAEISSPGPSSLLKPHQKDYSRVRLTEKGWEEHALSKL